MLRLIHRSTFVALRRHPAISISPRMISDRITDAYKAPRPQPEENKTNGYATKASFNEQMKSQRFQGAEAGYGEMPTNWQKLCLLITRVYRTSGDIPAYVTTGTMNRMYDRLRIVLISSGVAMFFAFFYYSHYLNVKRVSRDREAGVIIRS